jgi:hypothetical protein
VALLAAAVGGRRGRKATRGEGRVMAARHEP